MNLGATTTTNTNTNTNTNTTPPPTTTETHLLGVGVEVRRKEHSRGPVGRRVALPAVVEASGAERGLVA